MTTVIAARDAYVSARKEAKRRRLALGQAIQEARAQKVPQGEIAMKLELTREQIRRYQREYEKSLTSA
jgi:hypothetical protein